MPATVHCPFRDAFRSAYLWLPLLGLLLLRRANRGRRAWSILLPALTIYAILHVAENLPSAPMTWYVSIYIRSITFELLRSLTLGLAFLLALSDVIMVRSRVLRFTLALLIVFAVGGAAILLNAPLAFKGSAWVLAFGVVLLATAAGASITAALLRRLSSRHYLAWCTGTCLVFGVGPVLIIEALKLLNGSTRSLNVLKYVDYAANISRVVFSPYLVLFCFVVPILLSPSYRRSLVRCFVDDASTPLGTQP